MKGFLVMFSEAELQALHARKANGDIKSIGAFVRDAVMLHVERQGWVGLTPPASDSEAVAQGKAVMLPLPGDVVEMKDVGVLPLIMPTRDDIVLASTPERKVRKPRGKKIVGTTVEQMEMSELAQVPEEEKPRDISEIGGEAAVVKAEPEENLFG